MKYKDAFQRLKDYLMYSYLLAKLKLREVLLLYLVVSKHANRSVLLKEDKSGTTTHLLHQQGHD